MTYPIFIASILIKKVKENFSNGSYVTIKLFLGTKSSCISLKLLLWNTEKTTIKKIVLCN